MAWNQYFYNKIASWFESKPPIPPACGEGATENEMANSKKMAEERKAKEKADKAEQGKQVVVSGAKISCPLCIPPMGTLMVTDPNPSANMKPMATESDIKKTNLLFTGMCSKSTFQSTPCAALIQPGQWQKTGSFKVQNKAPLLFESTMKCMYGNSDITFINSGQLTPPFVSDSPGPDRESKATESVNIRVSVFFDGTLNNLYNTEDRLEYEKYSRNIYDADYETNKKYKKARQYKQRLEEDNKTIRDNNGSYSNDYTNVARLFKNYKEDEDNEWVKTGCVYVEGIATTTHGDDSTKAGMFGYGGDTGILDKVEAGCNKLAAKIKKLALDDEVASLTIDVFGFSRGAAAARNFIYEITQDKKAAYPITINIPLEEGGGTKTLMVPEQPAFGRLGKALKDKKVTYDGEIKIMFAGLFDTVPAYLLYKEGVVQKLHLDAVRAAKSALHLTAMDERRANFALVDITNSKGEAFEKALPGVHSDVGGGYNPIDYEKNKKVYAGDYDQINNEKRYLVEEGWFWNENQLEGHIDTAANFANQLAGGHKKLQGYIQSTIKKEVKNKYSYIPLHIMQKKAADKPNYIKFTKDLDDEFEIPDELTYTSQRLNDYVFKDEKPMTFYTRKQLDREIEMIEILDNPKAFINSLAETRVEKPVSTYVATPHPRIELAHPQQSVDYTQTNQQEEVKDLNYEDYPAHPELQQKIKDHQTLRGLRAQYFHMSHECSLASSFTDDLVQIFDPYQASIRATPPRLIIKG